MSLLLKAAAKDKFFGFTSCLMLGFLAIVFLFANVHPASALPAFARKYGMPCSSCHEAWPKLSPFGQAFKDNGYQLENERCAKHYATPATTESVVTDPNHGLENVVVYVSAGAPDEPAPEQPAVLTQKGCRYAPHVTVLQVNQELEIVNDDQAFHNIHPLPKNNREWNKSQTPRAPPAAAKDAR